MDIWACFHNLKATNNALFGFKIATFLYFFSKIRDKVISIVGSFKCAYFHVGSFLNPLESFQSSYNKPTITLENKKQQKIENNSINLELGHNVNSKLSCIIRDWNVYFFCFFSSLIANTMKT